VEISSLLFKVSRCLALIDHMSLIALFGQASLVSRYHFPITGTTRVSKTRSLASLICRITSTSRAVAGLFRSKTKSILLESSGGIYLGGMF